RLVNKTSLSQRQTRTRPRGSSIFLRLEYLEDRTLLDGGGKQLLAQLNPDGLPGIDPGSLHHPEAILAPIGIAPTSHRALIPEWLGQKDGRRGGPGTPPNVLVNDPLADGTSAQDTQSETSLVLGADNTIVVAFDDSNRFVQGSRWQFTGYSVSSDSGKS